MATFHFTENCLFPPFFCTYHNIKNGAMQKFPAPLHTHFPALFLPPADAYSGSLLPPADFHPGPVTNAGFLSQLDYRHFTAFECQRVRFFTCRLHRTLYEVPAKYKGKFPEGRIPLNKCIRYTDYSLQKFFDAAKKMPWFENTLFVITADHAVDSDIKEYYTSVNYFAIPLLFIGDLNNGWAHDYWFGVIAALYGGLKSINEPLIYYRQHESNTIGIGKNMDLIK